MMIIKRKAISQVISLLALENNLFFAASSATYGMPFIVELGIAFDVLVALFIFGIFFFRIRDTFENFDLDHLEKLREE
jgi:hydrogenase-4 component E